MGVGIFPKCFIEKLLDVSSLPALQHVIEALV